MIIYLIRNKINGKGYVGKTIRAFEERWNEHCYHSGKTQAVDYAIRKYGVDAFEHCILAETDRLEELNRLEIEEIKKQGTLAPEGYNLTPGGDGGYSFRNHRHTKEAKDKMRAAKSGSKASLKTRMKMSESRTGNKNGFFGKKHSLRSKDKMRAKRLGKIPWNKGLTYHIKKVAS